MRLETAREAEQVAGQLKTARVGHSATLLQSGKVLVVGGQADVAGVQVLTSSELFDPATGTAVVIDPGDEAEAIVEELRRQGLRPRSIRATPAPPLSGTSATPRALPPKKRP